MWRGPWQIRAQGNNTWLKNGCHIKAVICRGICDDWVWSPGINLLILNLWALSMGWLRQVDIWVWDNHSIMGGDRLQSYSYLLWTPANDFIITEHTWCLRRALGCAHKHAEQARIHTHIQYTSRHTHILSPGPDSLAIIRRTSFPNGGWHYIKHNKGFHLLLFINPRTSAHTLHTHLHTCLYTHTELTLWENATIFKTERPTKLNFGCRHELLSEVLIQSRYEAIHFSAFSYHLQSNLNPCLYPSLTPSFLFHSILISHLFMSNGMKLKTFCQDFSSERGNAILHILHSTYKAHGCIIIYIC